MAHAVCHPNNNRLTLPIHTHQAQVFRAISRSAIQQRKDDDSFFALPLSLPLRARDSRFRCTNQASRIADCHHEHGQLGLDGAPSSSPSPSGPCHKSATGNLELDLDLGVNYPPRPLGLDYANHLWDGGNLQQGKQFDLWECDSSYTGMFNSRKSSGLPGTALVPALISSPGSDILGSCPQLFDRL